MKIEGNQKELDAMVEFHKGNRVEGLRLQEELSSYLLVHICWFTLDLLIMKICR